MLTMFSMSFGLPQDQRGIQKSAHRRIRIVFRSHHALYADTIKTPKHCFS